MLAPGSEAGHLHLIDEGPDAALDFGGVGVGLFKGLHRQVKFEIATADEGDAVIEFDVVDVEGGGECMGGLFLVATFGQEEGQLEPCLGAGGFLVNDLLKEGSSVIGSADESEEHGASDAEVGPGGMGEQCHAVAFDQFFDPVEMEVGIGGGGSGLVALDHGKLGHENGAVIGDACGAGEHFGSPFVEAGPPESQTQSGTGFDVLVVDADSEAEMGGGIIEAVHAELMSSEGDVAIEVFGMEGECAEVLFACELVIPPPGVEISEAHAEIGELRLSADQAFEEADGLIGVLDEL